MLLSKSIVRYDRRRKRYTTWLGDNIRPTRVLVLRADNAEIVLAKRYHMLLWVFFIVVYVAVVVSHRSEWFFKNVR